jgi:hypothetical protein
MGLKDQGSRHQRTEIRDQRLDARNFETGLEETGIAASVAVGSSTGILISDL